MVKTSNQRQYLLLKPYPPFGLPFFSYATITYGALGYLLSELDGNRQKLKYTSESGLLQRLWMVP